MKVFFDHQIFSMQRFGGISRYFANIHNYLNRHGHSDSRILALYTRNHYVRNLQFPLNNFCGELLLKKQRKLERWNKRYSRYIINKNDFDLLHPTYYDPYFLSNLKKPFVLTVHDMIHELFPEYFSPYDQFVPFKRTTITKADHIIAISQSTKKDLQQIFNIPDHKITVVYHGYMQNHHEDDPTFTPPYQDYLLYVGDRGTGYKNFARFIRAVQPLMNRYNINLICTGGGDWGVAERELLIRAGIQDRTMQISATEAQLNMLYQKAVAFVFPSLYEGFGFPILEAFKNNCPVITSNTSCFKEVGGEAAAYFDPYQQEDMTHVIESVISNDDKATLLKNRGRQQLSLFSMHKCMESTLEVYRKLV